MRAEKGGKIVLQTRDDTDVPLYVLMTLMMTLDDLILLGDIILGILFLIIAIHQLRKSRLHPQSSSSLTVTAASVLLWVSTVRRFWFQ